MWRVLHALDHFGQGTQEQIADYTGLSTASVGSAARVLRTKGIIEEV